MTDWLGHLTQIVSVIADSKAILIPGGLVLMSVGAVPRLGFGRAITFGWKSYFRTTHPLSVRKAEINRLSESLRDIKEGSYITIIGGKGNGKSCLVDTTLNSHYGVVKISTKSGADKDLIIDQVLREIAGFRFQFSYLQPIDSVRRVLFFYNLMFKLPPIVVIRVPERQAGQIYADVTAAVRSLVDDFGLRVIVDGSPNSIPPELLTTTRETVMVVEPMSRDQIESIPEFQSLIDVLKAHKLDGPVWNVLGGSPSRYLKLGETITEFLALPPSATASDEVVDQVKGILLTILSDALNSNILNSSVNTKAIIRTFREKKVNKMSKAELEAKGLLLDYPNKVFREVKSSDDCLVEPATPAISLIITENIVDKVGIRKLHEKLFQDTKHITVHH